MFGSALTRTQTFWESETNVSFWPSYQPLMSVSPVTWTAMRSGRRTVNCRVVRRATFRPPRLRSRVSVVSTVNVVACARRSLMARTISSPRWRRASGVVGSREQPLVATAAAQTISVRCDRVREAIIEVFSKGAVWRV